LTTGGKGHPSIDFEYVPKYRRIMSTPTVAFSELSKNSKRVADTLDRTQRVHITRRDGEDLYLTTLA